MKTPPRRPVSVARRLSERARSAEAPAQPVVAIETIFSGLKEIAEAVRNVAGTTPDHAADAASRVVFGVSMNTLDGVARTFGHVPRPQSAPGAAPDRAAVVPEARTPVIEIFEEAAAIVVIAEVPGLDPALLNLSVDDGVMLLEGGGAQRYSHRVELPCAVDAAAISHACRNGILEIRLPRATGAPS